MFEIIEKQIHDDPTDDPPESYFVLAEGPRRTDAKFAFQWLSAAIEADRLLLHCLSEEPAFHASIVRLECPYRIEFGPSALHFIGMWQSEQGSFSLDFLDPEWAGVFCVMVGLGFFRQIGQRYQMTVPATVEILEIKVELLYLNASYYTDERLHPEALLDTMPRQQVMDWKRKLKRMRWEKRIADRDALLAE
jgi:hypothetical protein